MGAQLSRCIIHFLPAYVFHSLKFPFKIKRVLINSHSYNISRLLNPSETPSAINYTLLIFNSIQIYILAHVLFFTS